LKKLSITPQSLPGGGEKFTGKQGDLAGKKAKEAAPGINAGDASDTSGQSQAEKKGSHERCQGASVLNQMSGGRKERGIDQSGDLAVAANR